MLLMKSTPGSNGFDGPLSSPYAPCPAASDYCDKNNDQDDKTISPHLAPGFRQNVILIRRVIRRYDYY